MQWNANSTSVCGRVVSGSVERKVLGNDSVAVEARYFAVVGTPAPVFSVVELATVAAAVDVVGLVLLVTPADTAVLVLEISSLIVHGILGTHTPNALSAFSSPPLLIKSRNSWELPLIVTVIV